MILPRTGDRNEATSKGEYDNIAVDKFFDYEDDANILEKGIKEIGDFTLGSLARGYNTASDLVMGDVFKNPEYQRDWSWDDDFFDVASMVPGGIASNKLLKSGVKGAKHISPLLKKGKLPKGSLGRSFDKLKNSVTPSKKSVFGTSVAVPTVGALSDGDDTISFDEDSLTNNALGEVKEIIKGNKENKENKEAVKDAPDNNPKTFDNPNVDSSSLGPQIDTTALRIQINKMLADDQNIPGGLSNSNTVYLRDLQKELYEAEKKNKRSLEEDEIVKARGIPTFDDDGKPIPFEDRKQMVRDMVQTKSGPETKSKRRFDRPTTAARTDEELKAQGLVKDPITGTIREKDYKNFLEGSKELAGFDSLDGRIPDGKGGYSQPDPLLDFDSLESRIPEGEGGYSQADPLLKTQQEKAREAWNNRTAESDLEKTREAIRAERAARQAELLTVPSTPGLPLDMELNSGKTVGYENSLRSTPGLPLDMELNSGKAVGVGNSVRSSPGLPADMALNTGNSFDTVTVDPSLSQERDLWERRVKDQEDKRKAKRMGMASQTPYDPNLRNIRF